MPSKFYDKVARKFGKYHTDDKHFAVYKEKDPEKAFKQKLLGLSGKDKVILDVGCADGRFTLSIAPNFKKVVAIDLSQGMLKAARSFQKEKGTKNVSFEKQNAFKTSYKDKSFDIVFSRRGPTPLKEACRLLKNGGYFLEIDIGEKDC